MAGFLEVGFFLGEYCHQTCDLHVLGIVLDLDRWMSVILGGVAWLSLSCMGNNPILRGE